MNRDKPLEASLLILDDSLRIVGNIHPKNGVLKKLIEGFMLVEHYL